MNSAAPLAFAFVIAAIISARLARQADARSAKLGKLGVACGLAAFAPALIAPAFARVEEMDALAVCGGLTLVLAVAAIGLATLGVFARRKEPNGKYPLFGFILGAVNLACGAGILVSGMGILSPAQGTRSVWRSGEHGFEVTVPTEHWERHTNPNVLAEFKCKRPVLSALVAKVFPAPSDAAFEAVVAFQKAQVSKTPHTEVVERTGPNAHGRGHWFMTGKFRGKDAEEFFGISVTRVGDSAVLLLFSAPYRMASESGRAQEARALRAQSELFLGSAREISPAPAP